MPSDLFSDAALPPTLRAQVVGAVAYISIGGAVDLRLSDALDGVVSLLRARSPHTALVDVEAVTYGGSELINFIARVAALPGAVVVVCRPTARLRRLLALTRVDDHVGVTAMKASPPCRIATPRMRRRAGASGRRGRW